MVLAKSTFFTNSFHLASSFFFSTSVFNLNCLLQVYRIQTTMSSSLAKTHYLYKRNKPFQVYQVMILWFRSIKGRTHLSFIQCVLGFNACITSFIKRTDYTISCIFL
uniref:Uncharacterized protein n=1 Tax=Opuntia streptacantha TaxID=393608 RepID=A0A7C9A5C7_OPUST